uniref:LRR receptor-like serine/threonine-protein kinase n=1 Tax=Oryza barthii TaxID=65489 RepID=A0A0D3GXB1_9ORYZ
MDSCVYSAALSAILGRWGTKPPKTWNTTGGDPCTGTAVDDTDIDNNPIVNPGIKCDCTYNNNTVCHIIKLYTARMSPSSLKYYGIGLKNGIGSIRNVDMVY